MPNYFAGQSPWVGAAQIGDSIGNTVNAAQLQIPQARAQGRLMNLEAMQRQQQLAQTQALLPGQLQLQGAQNQSELAKAASYGAEAGKYKSEAGEYDSEAALNKMKTGQLSSQEALHLAVGKAAGDLMSNPSPASFAAYTQAILSLDKTDPDAVPSLLQMLSAQSSGLATNPALGASMVTGAKVPMRMNVPAGSTSVSTMNPQQAPFQSAVAPGRPQVNQGDQLIESILKAREAGGVYGGTNVSSGDIVKDIQGLRSGLGFSTQVGGTPEIGGQPQRGLPMPGDVIDGYRYKGGDRGDQSNWEPVQ